MNPVMLAAGFLMIGASLWAASHGSFKMAVIYVCYGVANFILATVKG